MVSTMHVQRSAYLYPAPNIIVPLLFDADIVRHQFEDLCLSLR
jgi:hypothetical protein